MGGAALSVAMAVYNGARYLEESLASLRAQRMGDFEAVVVDDGSTDDTARILERVSRQDARFIVLRQERTGQTIALNRAVSAGRGAYMARHDADDVSMPERFARQLAYLQAHPSVAAVGTNADVLDAQNRMVGTVPVRHGMSAVRRGLETVRATLVHGSVMMRRRAFEAAGGYREAFRCAQDFDLWLRLGEQGGVDNLPETLYQWRMNPEGVSATHWESQLRYAAVAVAFAKERRRYGADSYDLFAALDGEWERFVCGYRLRGFLQALWGELFIRGLRQSSLARPHLMRAVRSGWVTPRTLALLGFSALGLAWPGKPPLAVSGVR